MPSYIVEFTGTHDEKLAQAEQACREYLTPEQFDLLARSISSANNCGGIRAAVFATRVGCMIAGIRGYYPRRAMLLAGLRRQPQLQVVR